MENVLNELLKNHAGSFMDQLMWPYIVGFIFLTYIYGEIESQLKWPWLHGLKTRFKVAIIGWIYGIAYYFTNGLMPAEITQLVISYLFTFGFHKVFVDTVIGVFQGRIGGLKTSFGDVLNNWIGGNQAVPDLSQAPAGDSIQSKAEIKAEKKAKAKKIAIGVIDTARKIGSNPQVQKFVGGLLKGIFKK